MLKFIIDESTGLFVAEELQKDGFDTISVIKVIPGVKNGILLTKAKKEERILITNDKDFGELVYREKESTHGIILLRLANDTPQTRISVLRKIIRAYGEKLERKFTVVTETKIRIRGIV